MLSQGNRQVQVNPYTRRLFLHMQVTQGDGYTEL